MAGVVVSEEPLKLVARSTDAQEDPVTPFDRFIPSFTGRLQITVHGASGVWLR